MSNWKAVPLDIRKENKLVTRLYDLDTDIQEQRDVAVQHPDIVRKLESIIQQEQQTPPISRFLMPALEKSK